jgi:hypothetical protein
MTAPQTFAEVINKWPTAVDLAADVGVKEVTARAWKARGIPAEYWAEVVAAAEKRNIKGVTLDLLATLAAEQAGRAPRPDMSAADRESTAA